MFLACFKISEFCSQFWAQDVNDVSALPSYGDDQFLELYYFACFSATSRRRDFTRNYLYGTIPVEWASMKNLSSISLTANRLSGNIPAHLGRFTALTYLILSGNKLVGTLPEALAQIKNLKDFRVSDNILSGTVPEFIGKWTELEKLELYATGLQGPIPREIFHLEKLSDLRIADMPGPEFQLPNATIQRENLVLRNINLNGTIPEGVWKVEKTLDLTFNKLVGEIPPNTIRRQFTFLSGNKLTGTVQDPFLQNSQNLLTADSTAFNFVMLISYAS
ncbi:LRR receptor-like serine/threonine-protein kinase RFK1 [Populus alba x Populus x berolinensis]|nr:LRR receptor-like serine/threonine-protein kinase RFK1 [Populus alba x Populus x berolinensis]